MITKNSKLLLALFFFTSLGCIFFTNGVTEAAVPISSPISNLGPNRASGILNGSTQVTPYYTIGKGGYDVAKSFVSVTAPQGSGSFTITIENAGYNCSLYSNNGVQGPDFGPAVTDYTFYGIGGGTVVTRSPQTSSEGCGDISFTAYTDCSTVYYGNRCLYYLNSVLKTSSQDRENAFKVIANRTDVLIGASGSEGDYTGYGYRVGDLANTNHWGFNIQFGVEDPRCSNVATMSVKNAAVNWQDADSGPDHFDWNTDMEFTLWSQPIQSNPVNISAWNRVETKRQRGGGIGDDGSFNKIDFNANSRYMVTFENLGVRNTLRVNLPLGLSQLGARRSSVVDCPPPKPPTTGCGVINFANGGEVKPGQALSFNVSAVNDTKTNWNNGVRVPGSPYPSQVVYMQFNDDLAQGRKVYRDGTGNDIGSVINGSVNNNASFSANAPSTRGPKDYSFSLYQYISPSNSRLMTSCTITVNVKDSYRASLSVSCNGIVGNLVWASTGQPAIGMIVADGQYSRPINGQDMGGGVFSGWPGSPNGRIMPYGTHNFVILGENGEYVSDGISDSSIDGCFSATCSISPGSLLKGQPTNVNLKYGTSNRTDTAYTFTGTGRGIGGLSGYGETSGGMNPGDQNFDVNISVMPSYSGYILLGASIDGQQVPLEYLPTCLGAVRETPPPDCIPSTGNPACSASIEVSIYPAVKTFSGDTVAGMGFAKSDGTCAAAGSSSIKAYIASSTAGSGSQLGAFAPGGISGFLSSVKQSNAAPKPNGLTFGGTPVSGGLALNQTMGGGYNVTGCMENYFQTKQFNVDTNKTSVIGNDFNINRAEAGKQYIKNGDLTINGGDLSGKNVSVFVDGDVFLSGNITIPSSGFNPANPPVFRLYVKGNIYVSKDVTELNGVFVAQPKDDGNKGEIYTCASGLGTSVSYGPDWSTYVSQCQNQLKVYGSFTAKKVILNRIKSNGTVDGVVNLPSVPISENYNSTEASEVFIWVPYLYLPSANTSEHPTTGPSSDDYKFIGTLPPIL